MTSKDNFFRSNNEKFFQKMLHSCKNFSIIILSVAFLAVAGLSAATSASAQSNSKQSVCESYGFTDSRVDMDGIWKLTFTSGITKHETFMVIKKQVGLSLTRYFDSRLKRTRRISQIHTLCQSKVGLVILGFEPTDIDTNQKGTNLTYSADNFVISRQTNGDILAFNKDDAGNLVEIDIEFLEELPSDVKIK